MALAEVEHAANATLPPAKRPARLTALRGEIERLQRTENALLAEAGAQPSPDAPAEVVLAARITNSRGAVAA